MHFVRSAPGAAESLVFRSVRFFFALLIVRWLERFHCLGGSPTAGAFSQVQMLGCFAADATDARKRFQSANIRG
jgi:hypothetical protein